MPTNIKIKDPTFLTRGRILFNFLIIVIFATDTKIVITIKNKDNPKAYKIKIRIPSKRLIEFIALSITPINNGKTQDMETSEYNMPYTNKLK